MQTCPQCGEELPDKFRVCGYCGASLTPPAPKQEVRKTVTIVFTDLKGSTSMGESLDSESLREVMSRYFEEMSAALERHGGAIEKFIGDAVMAVFGLPHAHEDDALRAVRAALDMKKALAHLNDELEEGWGVRLTNRTGVNTGEVVAGDPTAGQHLVIGDAVNVAARLEQAAPANEILIGEPTYRLVREAVEVNAVEPLPLKGKSEPVPAHLLLDVTDQEGFVRHLDAPMVGREAELATMLGALDDAASRNECRSVTLVGEAGVGKSRLLGEFFNAASGAARVLRGRCLSYGEGITFWPVAEVVRGAAGVTEDDAPQTAREKVRRLGGAEEVTDRVLPVIGLSSGAFSMDETFWAIRKLFETMATTRPLVVVFEDIHWGEPTFLDLVEHIVSNSGGAALLVVCTARQDLLDDRKHWLEDQRNHVELRLQPLSETESAAIVANLLGHVEIGPELTDRIVEAAGGNPLFVEQLLSMMVEEGVLDHRADRTLVLKPDASFTVPSTIAALLGARLDGLPADERSALESGSVIGHVFYKGACRELSPESVQDRVGACLLALTRKDLVRQEGNSFADEEAFRFNHIMIRDSAYGAILKRRRSELHEAFALWLERRAGARVREYEEILGFHLEQAYLLRAELGPVDQRDRELAARAADRLCVAGGRAYTRGDMPAAANLLSRAATLIPAGAPERLALLPSLSHALIETGRFPQAERLMDEAIEGAQAINDPRLEAEARLVKLMVHYDTNPEGFAQEVLQETERAIPIFEEFGDHGGLAKAWSLIGVMHGTAARFQPAEEAMLRAVAHARLAGDRRDEIESLSTLTLFALYGPLPVPQAIDRCIQILREAIGERRSEALVERALAHLYAMQGRFDVARDLYQRSRRTLEDLGGRVMAAFVSLASAPVELLAGDSAAAERELRLDLEVLEKMGETYLLSTTAALLAEAVYRQGRYDEADELTRMSEEATAPDDIVSQVAYRGVRAKLLARQGRAEEAEAVGREGVRLASGTEEPDTQGHALMDLVETLILIGDDRAAVPVARKALDVFESKGNVVAQARVVDVLRDLDEKVAAAAS